MKIIKYLLLITAVLGFSYIKAQNLVRLENYIQNNYQTHVVNETGKISFLYFPETNKKIEIIAFKNKGKVYILVHGIKTDEKDYTSNLLLLDEDDIRNIISKKKEFKEKLENTKFFKKEIISYHYTFSKQSFFTLRSRSPNTSALFLWINGSKYRPPYKPFMEFLNRVLKLKKV